MVQERKNLHSQSYGGAGCTGMQDGKVFIHLGTGPWRERNVPYHTTQSFLALDSVMSPEMTAQRPRLGEGWGVQFPDHWDPILK